MVHTGGSGRGEGQKGRKGNGGFHSWRKERRSVDTSKGKTIVGQTLEMSVKVRFKLEKKEEEKFQPHGNGRHKSICPVQQCYFFFLAVRRRCAGRASRPRPCSIQLSPKKATSLLLCGALAYDVAMSPFLIQGKVTNGRSFLGFSRRRHFRDLSLLSLSSFSAPREPPSTLISAYHCRHQRLVSDASCDRMHAYLFSTHRCLVKFENPPIRWAFG